MYQLNDFRGEMSATKEFEIPKFTFKDNVNVLICSEFA